MMEWHKMNSGNDQGLVADSKTGRNVAVTYDEKDAYLVAAAPELLAACSEALSFIEDMEDFKHKRGLIDTLQEAINKAKGYE